MSMPIGIALGTVKAVERLPVTHAHRVHLTIHCDDVRWFRYLTEFYTDVECSARLVRILKALRASDTEDLVGKQGRFIYNVWRTIGKPQSILTWGLPRRHFSPEFSEYLDSCTPEQVEEIRSSPGVLPFDPEPVTTGVYR